MILTKQHFDLIATTIRDSEALDCEPTVKLEVVNDFVDRLQATNPNFQAGRFVAACYGEDWHDMAGRKVRY